jgi:RNA polymerase sigma-70 factor (ECF subfamily)
LRLSDQAATLARMHQEAPANTPASFDEIMLPHLDAAHNLARWLLRGKGDAEDLVQDSLLRAFRYFATFKGGDARAWLLTIVRNTTFRWLRSNRGHQLGVEFDEHIHAGACDAPDPEALLLQGADRLLLEAAMRQLPARMREVLVLRELEGLSYKEIAEVIGAPIGTVMSTLSRARDRFQHAAAALHAGRGETTRGISRGPIRSVWVEAKGNTT